MPVTPAAPNSADIKFPISSAPGVRPEEGGGRLINAFSAKNPDGSRSQVRWRRSAGLTKLTSIVLPGPARGMIPIPVIASNLDVGEVLHVAGDRVYQVLWSQTQPPLAIDLGVVPSSGLVTIARDNSIPVVNIVASLQNAAQVVLSPAGPPTAYPDANLPAGSTSVSNHHGYFVYTYPDGRLIVSNLNSLTINPLSFLQLRGPLLRSISYGDDLIVFGENYFEIYRDVGSIPFPFAFNARVQRGLIGTFAISGFEPGSNSQLLWVADDHSVVRYNGSSPPVIVSNDDVVRSIDSVALGGQSQLESCTYNFENNQFWVLTYPNHWTWELNLTTGAWNQRESTGTVAGWQISTTAFAFNHWIASDRINGNVYFIDPVAYDEDGVPLEFLVESAILANFPMRMGIPRADFDVTTGVGNTEDLNPVIYISWSDDGGYSFGNEVARTLIPDAGRDQVTILRTGSSRAKGRRFRLRTTDPVHVTVMGGTMNVNPRKQG